MTSYSTIYERFLNRTTDFNLAELDDHTRDEMLKGWLNSAIANVRTSSDLSRNDQDEMFDHDLENLDIELLAMGMTVAWLDQTLNSTELTLMMIGGKEEKFYSQSNQIAELRALRADTLREMRQLHTYNTYLNNSYFDN